MYIKAITGFIDKETGASVLAGEYIDASEERAAELVKAGVCEACEPMPKNQPSKVIRYSIFALSFYNIGIDEIKPNAAQPRKTFDKEKLEDMAASIREHGIIQPIIVRPAGKGYEIVAGERRYRAARAAGLKEVPCIVRELTDRENMLFAIIENMVER